MLFLQGRREPGCVNLCRSRDWRPCSFVQTFLLAPSLLPLQQGGGEGSDIDNRHRGSRTRGSMRRMKKNRPQPSGEKRETVDSGHTERKDTEIEIDRRERGERERERDRRCGKAASVLSPISNLRQ